MESKDKEEESSNETIQESSNGGDNRLEVWEKKQVQNNDASIVLPHLKLLNISRCENFISLPSNLFLPSVKSVFFDSNEKLEAIPEQIHTFTSLEELSVYKCPNIHSFPKRGLPNNCREIDFRDLKIEEPPIGEWGLHLLPQLQRLTFIREIGNITDAVECIPGPDLQLPSSLSYSSIWGFKNLKSLNCSSFPNLTKIWISHCPELEHLGDYDCLPPNLTSLGIINCPRIQQQCEPDPNGLITLDFTEKRYILTNSLRIRFDMKYFEDEVHNGNWDEVERYLSGFTKLHDNRYSTKIYFEIRKQKYLEALDEHDRCKAVDILQKDLNIFSTLISKELFREITQLLTLDNFREHEQLSDYGDIKSERAIMLVELKKLIEANPLLCNKLQLVNPN